MVTSPYLLFFGRLFSPVLIIFQNTLFFKKRYMRGIPPSPTPSTLCFPPLPTPLENKIRIICFFSQPQNIHCSLYYLTVHLPACAPLGHQISKSLRCAGTSSEWSHFARLICCKCQSSPKSPTASHFTSTPHWTKGSWHQSERMGFFALIFAAPLSRSACS